MNRRATAQAGATMRSWPLACLLAALVAPTAATAATATTRIGVSAVVPLACETTSAPEGTITTRCNDGRRTYRSARETTELGRTEVLTY